MRHVRSAVVAVATFVASAAGAQTPGERVTVHGVAFDSLHNAPLTRATVTIAGTGRTTTTDTRGRFAFDTVAPGVVTFVVFHADLDTIGLGAMSARARVTDGNQEIQIAVPSFASMWRAACGAERAPGDSGLVYGTIRDSHTQQPIANASVSVSWVDLKLDSARKVQQKRWRKIARADARGAYGLCGVPASTSLRIQAESDSGASGLIDVFGDGTRVRRRDLIVGRASAADSVQRGIVVGMLTKPDHSPFEGARVVMDEVPELRSDREGRFVIRNVPSGTRQLQILSVGMAPVVMSIDVFPRDTTLVTAELRKLTTLDVVRVVGSAVHAQRIRDFEERRRAGWGYSIDSTAIGKVGTMAGVFGTMPNLRFQPIANTNRFVLRLPTGAGTCIANLWIDGVRQNISNDPTVDYDNLNYLHTDEIAAVEVYPRAMTVPAPFLAPQSECGAVIVWTKWGFGR